MIVITHLILAIFLFFSINLLGQYSPSSFGYYQLTTVLETDEAPAFNYIIRVLTPVAFIIIVSTILYSVGLDKFTLNIFLVNVYYVSFRVLFNLAINRSSLINWKKQFLYSISIIGLSFFTYTKFIKTKTNILPDFDNIANELWIIIIIFLYNFINNINTSDSNAQKRKDRYLENQFGRINRLYAPIIKQETNNLRLIQIALAIIIYEDFNRPKLFRYIENLNHLITHKPHTLGIMQVTTNELISDKESVVLGTKKLIEDFNLLKKEYILDNDLPGSDDYKDEVYQRLLIEKYNPDLSYSYEILQIVEEINQKYYSSGPRNLFNSNQS